MSTHAAVCIVAVAVGVDMVAAQEGVIALYVKLNDQLLAVVGGDSAVVIFLADPVCRVVKALYGAIVIAVIGNYGSLERSLGGIVPDGLSVIADSLGVNG